MNVNSKFNHNQHFDIQNLPKYAQKYYPYKSYTPSLTYPHPSDQRNNPALNLLAPTAPLITVSCISIAALCRSNTSIASELLFWAAQWSAVVPSLYMQGGGIRHVRPHALVWTVM